MSVSSRLRDLKVQAQRELIAS